MQGIENAPQDVGDAVKDAANWVGDKFGGAEGDVRRGEGDVQNFDNGVDQSYQQGEQQGENQGGW